MSWWRQVHGTRDGMLFYGEPCNHVVRLRRLRYDGALVISSAKTTRLMRLMLPVLAGCCGWYLAAIFGATSVGFAEAPHHDEAHETAAAGPPGHGGAHHENEAASLVPLGNVSWYRPMLYAIGLLFVAAVVLGAPALKLRGVEPPDPAADLVHHDAQEDEHE